MASKEFKTPIFSYWGTEQSADLLESAAAVTCFVSEAAVHFSGDKMDLGISEEGTKGLVMILQGVENTINLAIERL